MAQDQYTLVGVTTCTSTQTFAPSLGSLD